MKSHKFHLGPQRNFGRIFLALLVAFSLKAQTTTDTRDFSADYYSFSNGAGSFASNGGGLGLWANGNNTDKEIFISYQLCTDESSYANCTSSSRLMQIGDAISFEMKGFQVFGEVGVILNCSPSFSQSYSSKNSNQALEIRSAGHGDYWHIVNADATIETAFQSSSSSQTWDVSIELTSSTTATVTIGDGNSTFTYYPTLSNSQITHITFYLKDDWSGSANQNFYFGDDGSDMLITNDGALTITDPNDNLTFGNFSNPLQPGSTSNTINLNLTVDDDVTIEGVAALGGSLTVNTSKTLTLGLNSSNTYSQLKVGGSITNNGTVVQEQYMPSTGHHGISSPMTSGFTTTSGTSSTLYGYNATTGAWDMSPTTSTVGAGFFAPVQASSGFQSAAGGFSVTGTPNTSHTHSLGYAANTATGGSGSGWNLIGNPYTCGLDWTSVTKTNVNNAYYVWDASNGTYQYYSGSALTGTYLAASSILSGVIPPMQAFWVQTTSSGGSIVSTMASDGTVASSPTFYKTAPDNLILYAEDLNDPSLSDAMWITHAAGYTNDFEGDQDAWKRTNYGGQANIYSYHDGEKLAINAMDLSSTTSIPVGVGAPEAGRKYRIVLEQLVNNQAYQVVLEDKFMNSFTDITSEGYVFTYGPWQNEDPRFVLHINQSTVGMGERTAQEVKVYQRGDRLVIYGEAQKHSSYTLLSADGRILESGSLSAGMASIKAPQSGMYIIQIDGVAPVVQRIVIH